MRFYQEPHNYRQEAPYYWSEVEDALGGKHRHADLSAAAPAELEPASCPQCGSTMQPLYWANSDECWEGLCGVAGWIRYCLPCQIWTGLIGGSRLIN